MRLVKLVQSSLKTIFLKKRISKKQSLMKAYSLIIARVMIAKESKKRKEELILEDPRQV